MLIGYPVIRPCGRSGELRAHENAASANTMGCFKTKMLNNDENPKSLEQVNGRWVQKAMKSTLHRRIILDMDSSESPVHGERKAQRTTVISGVPITVPRSVSISSGIVRDDAERSSPSGQKGENWN